MLPIFCNKSPDDHDLLRKNKSLFNLKNTLFKSSNTLRLAFWLSITILLNVIIIVFLFHDPPASSSSSNSQIFDDPPVEQSHYIGDSIALKAQHNIKSQPEDVVSPVVELNQHLQHFDSPKPPVVEKHQEPQKIEPPDVEHHEKPQTIEAYGIEQHQKPPALIVERPQKTQAPVVQPQNTKVPVVEKHQQLQNKEAPVVEEHQQLQNTEVPIVEKHQQMQNTDAPVVEKKQQPQQIDSPGVEKHQQLRNDEALVSEKHHTEAPVVEDYKSCKSGKVFIYDLPPIFNKDLLDNCQELDPWTSRCHAVSNGGFGPKATGLESVVPNNLEPAWYWTDMYAAEVIYHTRMLNYSCITENQEEATAFYMPFYVGFAVGKYLWDNYTAKDRDRHGEMVLNWVKDQPSWKRFNGSDHFLIFGRLTWDFRRLTNNDSEWGSSFMYMPLMKNVLRVSIERNAWDPLEISVPYPTAFHPRSESDIVEWQNYIRDRKRTSLFCFVGATRKKIKNDFREILMNYCKNESEKCRVVDCSVTRCYDGAPAILEAFLDSDFCLQPKGDGFTRRSFFDCMLAGSIPVYFWKRSFEEQYQWHMPLTGRTSSVFIDKNEVRNDTSIIRKLLEAYSREEIKMMKEAVIDMIPRFLYAMSKEGFSKNGSSKDAFDITIEGILRKFQHQRQQQQQLQ